ncbi:MAG TPA: TolC family protein [Pyrinomonadaceae bacterium]|nr:TolC family protein [Pyrinomonadaceae bacterium]
MLIIKSRILTVSIALSGLLAFAGTSLAQTPAPSPTPRRIPDASRPPGQEQLPESARPNPNPQAPPGAPQTNPATPPGTQGAPTASPTPVTAPGAVPQAAPGAVSTEPGQEPREPVIPPFQPRPLPPLPSLNRLGVSGEAMPLSLNDAIKKALENNNDIEVARDDVKFAETQLRSLEGIFDPVFSITPTYDKRISPQQSSLGGGAVSGTTSSTTWSWSPGVTKQFGTGGGNYFVQFANSHTNTSNSFSLLNPFYSSNLSLNFTQPLLRNRSIDNNRRQIRIQRKRLDQSDADFRNRTIQIISQVQQAYWELVFALRDQQNQLANLNLSRENLKNVEAQIAAGAKAPLERAEVQTELANRESTLLVAVQSVAIAENNLKTLILKDPTSPDWSAQLTPTDTPKIDTTPVNLDDALKAARENRPELQRLRLQNDINAIDLQYFKNQTKPQIDLTGTVALTGLAGKDVSALISSGSGLVPLISGDPNLNANAFLLQQIRNIQIAQGLPVAVVPQVPVTINTPNSFLVGGYGQTLSNLFGGKTRNVTVGVAISLPFHNTTAEANLAGARIQKEQLTATMRSQEQVIEVDVRNSAQAVETARHRVLSAREARVNAEMQLEGEQRLYQVGRSTTFLLFQRENTLTNARASELRAETDYNKALADLQRATSTTLRANNVVVDSPSSLK